MNDRVAHRDVLLVYPPFVATSVNGPHLAMGVLDAYLTSNGMNVSTWDGNIRFVRWLLEPRRLEPRIAKLQESFCALNSRSVLNREEYSALRRTAKSIDFHAALAEATRGDDEASFGALAGLLGLVYGGPLSGIARSVDAVVEAAGDETTGGSILAEFLGEQEEFFTEAGRLALVGISVSFSEQLHAAALIAKEIERRFGARRPLVVLGGAQISLLAPSQVERLLQLPSIDAIVVHEGERPLELLIDRTRRALAEGRQPIETDLSDLPNLCTKARAAPSRLVEPVTPNDLPSPTFDPAEVRLYFPPLVLPVYATKGCYWAKCTFCDYTKLHTPGPRRWSERDVEKVIGDLKQLLARHAATTFHLISEAVPPRWYRRFATAVLREKLQLRFFSYLKNERPEVLTQDFFDQLSAAGVRCLVCGVESPVDRILGVIGKGVRKSDIEANFRMMTAAGIRGVCNLIPDYPSTRFEEAQEAITFVRENLDYLPSVTCQFFDLSTQSAIARSPGAYGITVDERLVDSSHGCHSLSFTHDTLTPEQLGWLRAAFPALTLMVARHHLTRDVVCTLTHPRFDWSRAAFVFSRFERVTTRFPMPAPWPPVQAPDTVQAGPEMLWLRHPKLDSEVALPAHLLPLAVLMERTALVPFEALVASVGGVDRRWLAELLVELARLGFVRKVFGGEAPRLPPEIGAVLEHAEPGGDWRAGRTAAISD